jgi:UDP-GlcNAc:undecaprenyl-phosphate/decaprenyl-phosphate GlcNAc-1-phosphate transferase
MYSIFFLGSVSFLLAICLTPLVTKLSLQLGIVDRPDHRKLHKREVPRVGGIAVAAAYGLAFATLLVSGLHARVIVSNSLPFVCKMLPAAALIFATGLVDDLRGLKPFQKLAGQFVAAFVAYLGGVRVLAVGGTHLANMWWSLPATIIWLIACTNAVNLIDGVDGLAAGVGFVATMTTLLAAAMVHNVDLLLATVPLAAALLGFLRYNFNPATIFLGDCGSLFIGFLLGCYGVLWSQKSATILGMTAPLIALSIPLLDTSLTIARRFLRCQPIFGPDRGHIHHRLLDRGLTPRRVALLLYGMCALAAVFSLSLASRHFQLPVILLFCVGVWIAIQRLGFVEFDAVGKMVLQGSFRKLLNSQISLDTFQSTLKRATTPDECWSVLRKTYQEFGFYEVRMQLAGNSYAECTDDLEIPDTSCAWRVEIPLTGADYIHLTRECDNSAHQNTVAPFADVLRKTLESKLSDFRTAVEPPRFQTASAGE